MARLMQGVIDEMNAEYVQRKTNEWAKWPLDKILESYHVTRNNSDWEKYEMVRTALQIHMQANINRFDGVTAEQLANKYRERDLEALCWAVPRLSKLGSKLADAWRIYKAQHPKPKGFAEKVSDIFAHLGKKLFSHTK